MDTQNRLAHRLEEEYSFNIIQYLREGFQIYKTNIGLFILFGFLYAVIMSLTSIIPFFGAIIVFLVYAPLSIGFMYGAHKTKHEEHLILNDFFHGFNFFGTLLVQIILIGLIVFAACIPFLIAFGIEIQQLIEQITNLEFDTEDPEELFNILLGSINWLLLFGLAMLPIVVSVLYKWSGAFVIFYETTATTGMNWSRKFLLKKFLPFLLMMFVLYIITYGISTITSFIYAKSLLAMLLDNPDAISETSIVYGSIWVTLIVGLCYMFFVPLAHCVHYAAFSDVTKLTIARNDLEEDILNHLVE